ncbi:transcriptional regulator [Rhizobium sophorae]|uniref:Transcriptional regulator n=1 Tax=Rhizobium sophorae TaxID=1535242 RepID=A0A7Y3WHV0_9HYPH|nr:transcriptional regulator [Rhizobium sophorae]NNU40588.1 transcriptional regulator [Rhizobium sophorae]
MDLLRAARFLLGYTQEQVENSCNLTRRYLYNLEAGKHLLLPRNALVIKAYFEREGVEFLEESETHGAGVRWRNPGRLDPFRSKLFRCARGLADLSQDKLADRSGVGRKFIAQLEQDVLKGLNETSLGKLEHALRDLNIEITQETREFGAGVRWIKTAVA